MICRALLGCLIGALSTAAAAQAVVYRCPGPPVLYTDAISPTEARERGCRSIEGAPITVVQSPRPRASAAPAPSASTPLAASRPADTKIAPNTQRQRDADAKRILADELKREEDKLVALKRDYNNGEPERRGEERNFQTYLDRVATMKASITRVESDIAAIKRELAKIGS
jgi:hypothetical protein